MRRLRPKRKVRVHLVDVTESVDGVLAGRTRDGILIRMPAVVHESGQSHQLDGEVLILRDRVAFIQLL